MGVYNMLVFLGEQAGAYKNTQGGQQAWCLQTVGQSNEGEILDKVPPQKHYIENLTHIYTYTDTNPAQNKRETGSSK